MPFLEISDGSGNIDFLQALYKLPAVMLFPEDETARKQYIAQTTVAFLMNHHRPGQNSNFPITPAVLGLISEGPRPDELTRRVAERIEQGKVARNILNLVLSLSQVTPEHATVRKVIRVLRMHLVKEKKRVRKEGKKPRHALPASSSSLKSSWARFKPVSHLWAAVPPELLASVSGPTPPFKSANFDQDRAFIDRGLKFLAVAEKIRLFGEAHYPMGGRNNSSPVKAPTLDPKTTWKVSQDVTLPRAELDRVAPPEWVMEELDL
jgi:hypothetical protein